MPFTLALALVLLAAAADDRAGRPDPRVLPPGPPAGWSDAEYAQYRTTGEELEREEDARLAGLIAAAVRAVVR